MSVAASASLSSGIGIDLEDVYVTGVDNARRAQSLKQWILGGGRNQSAEIPILNGVTLHAGVGERIGIIGFNGSGKSSLLKTIAGIYPPSGGRVSVRGSVAPIIETGVGYDGELTGRENIKLMMLYAGQLDRYSPELKNEIIAFTELGPKIDAPMKNFSSGMVSRLCFAVAFMQHADILLLDEVFATGDAAFIEKSRHLLRQRFEEAYISVLVSHDVNLVLDLCSRCLLMDDGRIAADGKPHDIVQVYQELVTAAAPPGEEEAEQMKVVL